MKTLSELSQHLKNFRENKAMFPSYNELVELITHHEKNIKNQIAVVWHIEDVQEVRPDLDDEECRQVLFAADDQHDATVGINWEVLKAVAESLFPEDTSPDYCTSCDGTGIGQHGDPDTSRCSSCGGSGVSKDDSHDDSDDEPPEPIEPPKNFQGDY